MQCARVCRPPPASIQNGQALTPAKYHSIEGGIKADLLDRRISATGSAFRIRRTNVPEADAQGFFQQIGEGESSGFEFEVVGSVTRGLGLRGGYAWTSTQVTRDTTDLPVATCRMLLGIRRSCGRGIAFQRAR
jgi:outer membrane receptor protein involved in Fe transport